MAAAASENPTRWEHFPHDADVGVQPMLIGGSMGTGSYILVGEPTSEASLSTRRSRTDRPRADIVR